jgi:hypothetical protein
MPCDPEKLKELHTAADVALFDLHRYMEQNGDGDGFWRDVYRHRAELGLMIHARMEYWKTAHLPDCEFVEDNGNKCYQKSSGKAHGMECCTEHYRIRCDVMGEEE